MANFLTRIALRGAGTRSLARPPVIAPPILPGRTPLVEPAVQTDDPSSPTIAQPAQQTPQPPLPMSSPASREASPKVARSSPGVPGGQRSAPAQPGDDPVPRPDMSETRNPNIVRAPRRIETNRIDDTAPSPPFALTPEPNAVIRAPKSSFRPARIEGLDFALPRLEYSVPSQEDQRPPEPSRADPPPLPRAPKQPAPANSRDVMPSTSRSQNAQGEVRPSVPLAPLQLPVSGNQLHREPRVTIGQVDVQVINQPPPVPTTPAASIAPTESTSFFNNEIERFRYRLP